MDLESVTRSMKSFVDNVSSYVGAEFPGLVSLLLPVLNPLGPSIKIEILSSRLHTFLFA